MASPDSLTAWRAYVDQTLDAPTRLGLKEVKALSPTDKAQCNRQRFAWLAADTVLLTSDMEILVRQADVTLARNAASTATARRGLALSGAPGMGKSTAVLWIGRRHEIVERRRLNRANDSSFAPVIYTVVPAATTPKMLMQAFAGWLGLPVLNRSSSQDITDQVVRVLKSLGTSLVIVDEVHNLKTNRQAGAEAANALKQFSDRLDATFLYAGIDLPASDLFAGDLGRQIKARMIVQYMHPYRYGSQSDREAWTDLVLAVEELLPLADHREGALESEATYLWHRTGGSIGTLRALLADAAIGAILDGQEHIDRRRLDLTNSDYASEETRAERALIVKDGETPRRLKRLQ